jgi:uncharacterized tellurite resistance protein B-like protein
MTKYYEIEWCEEELRYRSVPENGCDVPNASASTEVAVELSLWPKPGSLNAAAHWYPKSRIIDVHGYQIQGMVYLGTALTAVKREGIEPALINPLLRVSTPGLSYNGQDLPYCLSYENLSPQARGRYLQWLAESRKDNQISIGFVFLFFYGIERRLLADDCPTEERAELIAEIDRLRALYSSDSAFDNYSFRLLDFVQAKELDSICADIDEHPAPPVHRIWDQPYSSTLRVGLGQCAAYGMEVPAAWALAWAESHPGYRQRTAAGRCRHEFEELFRIEYERQFPDGFYGWSEERITFSYLPASASFARPLTVQSTLPDLTALNESAETLKNMAMHCLGQLNAYSRYLGRNPEARESVAGLALLPEPLFHSYTDRVLPDLRCWLETTLQAGFAFIGSRTLFEKCLYIAGPGVCAKKHAILLVQFLERLDVAMEPDFRFGHATPAVDGAIVLFRLAEERPESSSAAYSIALVVTGLAVAVILADQPATPQEEQILERHITETLDLAQGEKLRLKARMRWLLTAGFKPNSLAKWIDPLPLDRREAVGQFLLEVAGADGEINPSEIDILINIYGLLRMEPSRLFLMAHAHATESVSISQNRTATPGYTIPDQSQRTISSDWGIDMEKVKAMTSESERVSVLLRDIFVDEEHVQRSAGAAKEHMLDLDDPQSQFLARVLTRASWSRADLAYIAAESQLLLEGTIDSINDSAIDRYGDLLIEGQDPIHINAVIQKELHHERN